MVAEVPGPFTRVRLFGLDFVDAPNVDVIADALCAPVASDIPGPGETISLVITPNVDQLVKRDRMVDHIAAHLAEQAEFVLADGQPIVWASRLLGRPLRTRLPGSSLTAALWPKIVANERRALVVASSSAIAERIRREGPTLHAIEAPMLDIDRRNEFDEFVRSCVEAALEFDAEFVFVTLGYPSRENVIDGMLRQWPVGRPLPWFLAIGASFDMYYRFVRRAPDLVQRIGLEWLFRFVQEPRRLFRRYFVDDLAFAPMVIRELRSTRRTRRCP